jgi:2-dehydro-3-deoxyphosphooctonate aldolase (KDO 8-P synthase)
MIPVLARAGVAAGADGLFLEVHENPDQAPCDGPNSLKLSDLPKLLRAVVDIHAAVH